MARLLQPLMPGLEVKPLIAELQERMEEELDYRDRGGQPAGVRRRHSTATRQGLRAAGRGVRAEVPWSRSGSTARPLSDDHPRGHPSQRNDAGRAAGRLHYSSPAAAGLLHADPHPGNFQLLDDGRLLVLDFGAVARLPDGLPPRSGGCCASMAGNPSRRSSRDCARWASCVRASMTSTSCTSYLRPLMEPAADGDIPLHPGVDATPVGPRRRPGATRVGR